MTLPPNTRIMPDGNLGAEMDLEDIDFCTVTPAMIREVAFADHIISGPGLDARYMPTSAELETVSNMAQFAVNRGQMIDFGYWPNDMIREAGVNGGRLYCQGALGHPFSTPYIILHSWDDPKLPISQAIHMGKFNLKPDMEKHTCAYLVNPFPNGKELLIDFEAMTFEGITFRHKPREKYLGIGDRISLDADASRQAGYYAAQVIPYALRWTPLLDNPDFKLLATNRNADDFYHAACGNVLDPVMVALLILNTRGVEQHTVAASPKLNKARIKSNKPPIPPYRRVDTASYVTAVMNRVNRSYGPGTGTHASPVMHIRQGHWRHYKTGERSFIHDTLVNASPEMRAHFQTKSHPSGRSHYVVNKE